MKEPRGVFVPGEVLERRDLRTSEKLLLGLMENLSRNSGIAYASVEIYAGRLGIDQRTVRRALRGLEGRGLIVQEQPGGGREKTATYRLALAAEKPGQIARVSGDGNPDNLSTKPGQLVPGNAGNLSTKHGQLAPQVKMSEHMSGEGEDPAPGARGEQNGTAAPPDLDALTRCVWDSGPRPHGQTIDNCRATIGRDIDAKVYTLANLADYLGATNDGRAPFWKFETAIPDFLKRLADCDFESVAGLFAQIKKGDVARRKADGIVGVVLAVFSHAVDIQVTEPSKEFPRIETAEQFNAWEFSPPAGASPPNTRLARQDAPQPARPARWGEEANKNERSGCDERF